MLKWIQISHICLVTYLNEIKYESTKLIWPCACQISTCVLNNIQTDPILLSQNIFLANIVNPVAAILDHILVTMATTN